MHTYRKESFRMLTFTNRLWVPHDEPNPRPSTSVEHGLSFHLSPATRSLCSGNPAGFFFSERVKVQERQDACPRSKEDETETKVMQKYNGEPQP
jgi:hypothetical protein